MIAKSPAHFGHFNIAQYRFWIADPSAKLRVCPEFIEGTGFGLSDQEFELRLKESDFMLPSRNGCCLPPIVI